MIEYTKSMLCEAEFKNESWDRGEKWSNFLVETPEGKIERRIRSDFLMGNLKVGQKTIVRISMDDGADKRILSHAPNFRGVLNVIYK